MSMNSSRFRYALLGASAMISAAAVASAAYAADTRAYDFDMPAQPLTLALKTFGATADQQLIFSEALVKDRTAPALKGSYTPDQALAMLLSGSGLTADKTPGGVVTIRSAADPQGGSAAGGADGTVEALIVTAQKREEDIQDVPIAISAFTQEDLTRSQVAGGPDLITQVPNMTFTKTNFSSYSIQLRGIGTQAISATTDPAVAVAFNNTPFIRNRFFEQEFYDLQRVEVLRGPQGTLYGRNATAGVVNLISQKPKFATEAKMSADASNFSSSRLEGMVNIPLVEDMVALRVAGAWTKRDGYATNELTGNSIDGRNLWSTRVSLRVAPNDHIDANLIWEHFQEDDDRLRSGKQLCHKHVPTDVGGIAINDSMNWVNAGNSSPGTWSSPAGQFSQGCERGSLYSPEAFQTPNGLMLPYYGPLGSIGLPTARDNPYTNPLQSPDLRIIESMVDPKYTASSDLGELQVTFDIGHNLSLTSETAYAVDSVYSLQDFNRFNTAPGAWAVSYNPSNPYDPTDQPTDAFLHNVLDEKGVFCDPQLGCSDRLVAVDVSTARASQFSQELRIASDYDGPFNFSLGANFLRADSEDKYYVFINSLSLIAAGGPPFNLYPPYVPGVTDNRHCLTNGYMPGDPNKAYPVGGCIYLDPNPIDQVNDLGHNYFLSKNPYKLISYAVFGETYFQLADNLKLTAGLRWTVDKKEAPRIPSWLLATNTVGYPVAEVIEQEWREPTGRLAIDWKPDLGFTDETLLYASYSHGYKAGGANPPGFVRVFFADATVADTQNEISATRPKVFQPEFVDAFELGSKNTILGGAATLNLAAFYYDYKDYQISEIVDRSAFNRNFDATVWGIELEADWRPFENLRLGIKGGYEKTRIADGEQAIDLMDRTAGDPDWVLIRPFPTYASSCILPVALFARADGLYELGNLGGGNPGACERAYQLGVDPVTGQPYEPVNITDQGFSAQNPYLGWNPATAPNGGEGIMKQLGGNALPNAPEWTATLTGDYTVPLPNEWLATLHTDLHWQSESYWRVFQDNDFSKLDEYFTMNLAAIFTNEERGWNIMAYIKNVTDETAITGAFLNSDDTGLTTNVFLTEPRLYGLRVTKTWEDGSVLGGLGRAHDGPFPLTVELGGQVQRHDAPNTPLRPIFDDLLSPSLDVVDGAQANDLDWGDGREVRLTYRPASSPWMLSTAARFGETNHVSNVRASELGGSGCVINQPNWCANNPQFPHLLIKGYNYVDAKVVSKEEHTLVDFEVGHDVGFGAGNATLRGGLRYGEFRAETSLDSHSSPNWYVPPVPFRDYWTHTVFSSDLTSTREFKGLGPTVTWEGAAPLLGSAATGRVNADWSLTAGVLFGKQKTSFEGQQTEANFHGRYIDHREFQISDTVVVPAPADRVHSANAPLLDLSLGLSYQVQRVKVGAGYRWERYFDVLDAGFDKEQSADRTIDGPYFKIAVGFGG